ncbi:MAG: FAD-dependent oxidoreductase, partial [Thermoleophilaceae bacterium]
MNGSGETKEIAVLGGGVGGLTAAYHLTATPQLRERHSVTVYQLGWRLGGKGASGRNRSRNNRIEEHGLHVWGGFYENAFRLIRQCYAELPRLA